MGLIEVTRVPKPKDEGWGGIAQAIGTGLGAIGGAIAAPFTGGASIPAGISIGTTLGGAVGVAGQGRGSGDYLPSPQITAATSRLQNDPAAQVATLNQGLAALKAHRDEYRQIVEPYLTAAKNQIMG